MVAGPWRVVLSRQAQKDAKKPAAAGLKPRAAELLELIAQDPFSTPPRFEKLVGDQSGCYSRRIDIQHRLVHEVPADERVVHVLRMSPHDEWSGTSGLPVRPTTFPCALVGWSGGQASG